MSNLLPFSAVFAKKRTALALFALCIGLLIAVTHDRATTSAANTQPILGACSGATLLFPNDIATFDPSYTISEDGSMNPVGKLEAWRKRYDDNVNEILKAHTTDRVIQCTEVANGQPSGKLQEVASQLPPWSSPERLRSLSEDDMSAVLMEQLRVYQCRLREQLAFRWVKDDIGDLTRAGILDSSRVSLGTEWIAYSAQNAWVKQEFQEAPLALLRTLKFIEGEDRLRPLDDSLECLARASLDIRNTLGLAAEVSACLPRVWDARGTLRSLAPSSSSAPSS